MLELKPLPPPTERPPKQGLRTVQKQQRMMVVALALLVSALVFVLYRDRDFWFPDVQEADNELAQPASAQGESVQRSSPVPAKPRTRTRKLPETVKKIPQSAPPTEPVSITNRTVLPPLEIEVVAGNNHRIVRPGTNSVRVELLEESQQSSTVSDEGVSGKDETAAGATRNAAERAEVSTETTDIVTHAVPPGYPVLARQMKVQGSVVLQALIGRDGVIQDLRVLGGPPILANAAQEAVRQWHFKPHYSDGETVETQARITVNFMISTN